MGHALPERLQGRIIDVSGVIHVRGRRVGGARLAVAAQAHHLGQDRDAGPARTGRCRIVIGSGGFQTRPYA